MKISFNKNKVTETVENSYRTAVELYPKRQISMYISFVIVTLILFGGFGIRINLEQISAAKEERLRLESINQSVLAKLEAFKVIEKDLDQIRIYIPALNEAMPLEPKTEVYLDEFVREVGRQGYIVSSLRVEGVSYENGQVPVGIAIKGNPNDVGKLVTTIESLKRLTTVQSLKLSLDEDEADIRAVLVIYYIPPEKGLK